MYNNNMSSNPESEIKKTKLEKWSKAFFDIMDPDPIPDLKFLDPDPDLDPT